MRALIFFLILFHSIQSFSQNIGINNINPEAALHLRGDIIYDPVLIMVTDTAINEIDVSAIKAKNYTLTGPNNNFALSGISQGVNGREINLFNMTGHSMELYNDYLFTADSTRIFTGTGSTLAVFPGGNVSLKYDTTLNRWQVINAHNYSLNYYGTPNVWSLNGNSGTNATQFIGTNDAQPIRFKVNGQKAGLIDSVLANTVLGYGALKENVTGVNNVAIGKDAFKLNNTYAQNNVVIGANAMQVNSIAEGQIAIGYGAMQNYTGTNFPSGQLGIDHNTAVGYKALQNNNGWSNTAIGGNVLNANTQGSANTALGDFALYKNTIGSNNIAIGSNALKNNITFNYNTAVGSGALEKSSAEGNTAIGFSTLANNLQGIYNTAIGANALLNNKNEHNTAVGGAAMYTNTFGVRNTAIGLSALFNNTIGGFNTASGFYSLFNNIDGGGNSAYGENSLLNNQTGDLNVAIGGYALKNNLSGNSNTSLGYEANLMTTTGSWNTTIGDKSNTSLNNLNGATAIGSSAVVTSNNKIMLGGNVGGMEVQSFGPYTNISDGRFKENIKENIPGLNFITKLRPVSYTFNTDKLQRHITKLMPDTLAQKYLPSQEQKLNANKAIRTGFIAQEVEDILKRLNINFDGLSKPENETDTYSISYGQFVVPLVKAVQEQQAHIEELKAKMEKIESQLFNILNQKK